MIGRIGVVDNADTGTGYGCRPLWPAKVLRTCLLMSMHVLAPVLYQALSAAAARFQEGERRGNALRRAMQEHLDSEPLTDPVYVSAADPQTLVELDHVEATVLLSMAVRIGATRLIDNLLLTAPVTASP